MLTDTILKNLKSLEKQVKYSDSGGLHILVKPTGSKLWKMAYRFDGKQKTLSLGAYPAVTLAQARKKRDNAKSQIAAGIDPSEEKRQEKIKRKISAENTFGAIAEEFLAKCVREGKSERTIVKKRWL
ncbi:MAG: Arm DNA-binding domain-containing protein, partial [Pseudomonadota bacterium]